MTDILKDVAKQACRHAISQQLQGCAPTFLGVNGLLALMHKAIQDYNREPTRAALLDLCASGLHALSLVADEEEFESLFDSQPPEEEDFAEGVVRSMEAKDPFPDVGNACSHEGELAQEQNWIVCSLCGEPIRELREGEQMVNSDKEDV